MTARLPELPAGYRQCVWCKAANKLIDGHLPLTCFQCGLNPSPGAETKTKKETSKATTRVKSKPKAPANRKIDTELKGQPVIGIDPGARYTGVSVRDGDVILHSTTLVRNLKDTPSGSDWALLCVAAIQEIKKDFPVTIPVAIEGISDPKGFQNGKRAAINPKDIIRAAIVLGACVATWPQAVIVPPGNNGSLHDSHYPVDIIGRRPKTLPGSGNGAGTRNHEKSAYDVAGKAAKIIYPAHNNPIDFQ